MGTWGTGNFESDYALDFMATEVHRHIQEIEAILADGDRFQLDEEAEAVLMPSIHILIVLCQHCHAQLPEDLDIVGWKASYLEMFDKQIDELSPAPGYKEERRYVIAATFDRLAAHQQRSWRM